MRINKILKKLVPLLDILLIPLVIPTALILKKMRYYGFHLFPSCRNALINSGVFPVTNHYYEPQIDNRNPIKAFSSDRDLPGINWNIDEQLHVLSKLIFADELGNIPFTKPNKHEFYFNNGSYESGDAEYWYQIIRLIKPKKIFEVGCGNSTLMAIKAIKKNHEEDCNYTCKHICIEPYEMPWLEEIGVSVVRQKIETLDVKFFSELEENDFLFIDSSHIIRPQGDVLYEYLELLPTLNKGVIVHVHDIFSPKNYLKQWLIDEVKFWNEQYLLEAFLSHNSSWEIIGALNYLHHNHYANLKLMAPFLSPDREPGSFYIKKISEARL